MLQSLYRPYGPQSTRFFRHGDCSLGYLPFYTIMSRWSVTECCCHYLCKFRHETPLSYVSFYSVDRRRRHVLNSRPPSLQYITYFSTTRRYGSTNWNHTSRIQDSRTAPEQQFVQIGTLKEDIFRLQKSLLKSSGHTRPTDL